MYTFKGYHKNIDLQWTREQFSLNLKVSTSACPFCPYGFSIVQQSIDEYRNESTQLNRDSESPCMGTICLNVALVLRVNQTSDLKPKHFSGVRQNTNQKLSDCDNSHPNKMSFHVCDNIYTTVFTPRDYQVELLATAYERNTLTCLGHKSSKEFISLKLVQELARLARSKRKCSIYLSCGLESGSSSIVTMLHHLTDLKVFVQPSEVSEDFKFWMLDFDVYIVHPRSCLNSLRNQSIKMEEINLIILEDCHEMSVYEKVVPIFQEFYLPSSNEMPKVLGLAGPLHSAGCGLQELGAMLNSLEANVQCTAETASDIVTVLRYCAKPFEYIIQCAPFPKDELTSVLEDIICTRKTFLQDHRYDPFEIYSTDEFLEELKEIPDPKREPLEFLDIILTVLHEMGPWCAERVALNMFHRIEKQKIKTPHERHYILLCLVNTALLEIRAICERNFRKFNNHKELVERYCSPKIIRLLEILRLFKSEEFTSDNETIQKLNLDLEKLDFHKITRTLEYSCQNVESLTTRQQLESRSIVENLDAILKPNQDSNKDQNALPRHVQKTAITMNNSTVTTNANTRRNSTTTGRMKRRPFVRRQMRGGLGSGDNGDGLDTLCGIIFCNCNYTARVLFDLLAEMSRHDLDLKFLKCQFTTDRVADPQNEPKEAELEHRRQEEVLKRFRIHDCNLLIGTSILEEGIDLPKCNLVVRWDPPLTYRSYVQCKGRARAAPAYHIILVAPKFDVSSRINCKNDQIRQRTHEFLCQLDDTEDTASESDSNEDNNCESNVKIYAVGSSKGIVRVLNPEVITSMPPTMNDIRLKEIKDELPAIENVKDKCKSSPVENNEANNISLTEIDDSSQTLNGFPEKLNSCLSFSQEKLTKTNGFSTEFEIVSLTEIVEKINLTLDSPSFDDSSSLLKNNFLSENDFKTTSNAKSDEPVTKIKSERYFQCCLHDSCLPDLDDELFRIKVEEMNDVTNEIVDQLAQYREIEKMLLKKCANFEPPESEHHLADKYTFCIAVYKPQTHLLTGASVDLSTSIALVNKYCSKLPSDTFTKLTALWRCAKTKRNKCEMYQYTLRLPINSPLKYDIVGLPMSSNILARRMAAFQACIELHKTGELDDNLQPIGKEGFRAIEADWENFDLEEEDEKIVHENIEPRPGTTKRRQYYYKRIASEFCNCRPTAGVPCYLYMIDLTLQCPIPEEQNTRGRKIYPPEDAQQGFGILTLKSIPKVSSFPIFTRSGEVKVSIELAKQKILLTEAQIRCINTFVNYTFTNVLRLQKFLMLFDPESTENCVFIVPTIKTQGQKIIDWRFLDLIEKNASMIPSMVSEEERKNLEFDANKFRDAVVMPWYRNQDQPQYFYVAEICPHLSPLSCFPGENYNTFKHYYFVKYGLVIQNTKQPLLDVDHTSARLNFLTPRYVNRKGVALPTSSEETKRAKRENLEQKQILVPELCTVHPFPASLWRTAVCLPCILYRINGLLLADDIRKKVSADIALGRQEIEESFKWPMLNFGWSFSEVLKKSKESQKLKLDGIKRCDLDEGGKAVQNISASSNNVDTSTNSEHKTSKDIKTKSANEICMEGEKKLQDDFIEIGTWSNEMAEDVNMNKVDLTDDDDEELMKFLPSNVSFCDQRTRYGSPTFWDIKDTEFENVQNGFTNSNELPYSKNGFPIIRGGNTNFQKPFSYYGSDDSLSSSNVDSVDDEDDTDDAFVGPFHISFTSKNEAESYETAAKIEQRQKQLSIIQATTANERIYQQTKNLHVGYNFVNLKDDIQDQLRLSVAEFLVSTELLKEDIKRSGMLIAHDQVLNFARKTTTVTKETESNTRSAISGVFFKLMPYVDKMDIVTLLEVQNNALTMDDMKELNRQYVRLHPEEMFTIVGTGDLFDNFNDKSNLVVEKNENYNGKFCKRIKLNFESMQQTELNLAPIKTYVHRNKIKTKQFSFDFQPNLNGHPGPSPSIILQALTMSNANDGINLERLETIGDSFLKYAITTYLYITYENVHEGKLSHLRSKQVANLNLYRLGRRKNLGEYMIATKFEPHDNWLPPCYYVPKELEKALIEAKIPPHHWKLVDLPNIKKLTSAEICELVREKADKLGLFSEDYSFGEDSVEQTKNSTILNESGENGDFTCFIPYNLVTQHSIPDKSIADCVEALIGAYLIECGPRGALLFMAWLGIRVLPYKKVSVNTMEFRLPGSTGPDKDNMITIYGELQPPKSPLLHFAPDAEQELDAMLEGFDEFERTLGYKFNDRSYLLQAMTHASYTPNRLTDCYQRLEFLGDAVLDYLITRHLYEDPWQHSPGALTDLRSALVNNTIFASLAVRHGFHKYFRHLSPGLNDVIDRFVRIQNENGHSISEEFYLLSEEECDDAEDVEVPKALGDVFESVAGAIFLDSGMSLDTVWMVYSNIMKPEIEQFSNSVPKSPIRELLELEPETAKFGKPEKLADGRRVRVTVDVFCKGTFRGIGRNYRIAKCTAAKCALRQLKKQGLISKKD